jgi:hypothetical protein
MATETDLRIELDENGNFVPVTREKAGVVLRHLAKTYPPSRFAVYEIVPDEDGPGFDGQVVAWGLGYDDHLDVQSIEPGMRGRFSSVESMSFLFGDAFEIVWIDPEPTPSV